MINIYKSNRTEYGVTKQGEDYIFTSAFCVKNSLILKIYSVSGEAICELDISNCRLAGNVYSVKVSGIKTDAGFQYEYICDGLVCLDPYMRRHTLKRVFSEEKKDTDIDRALFLINDDTKNDDTQLNLNYSDIIAYQLHVRGFTRHSSSKVKGRGCFLGITEKIPYLQSLCINQIELMPAYDFYEIDSKRDSLSENHPMYASDKTLDINGNEIENKPETKVNYWGYKEANYFCPKPEYSFSDDYVAEFKDMVFKLHRAGIEVVMQMYFPKEVKTSLIRDCLRFWYLEYHVDGFHLMGENIPIDLIVSDDILSLSKLYFNNLYNFDSLNSKYSCNYPIAVNNEFMTSVRRFLKSDFDSLAAFVFANRSNPNTPYSLNRLTCYEGFTLNDLVSYEYKHNESNGENNTDGIDNNLSWNCGVEGRSTKKQVKELRIRQIKNALFMLLLSQGTPMLFMGDEAMNTQNGNNNPYCQDNEISWLNWKLNKSSQEIFDFARTLCMFRKEHKVLHQSQELKNMDYLKCNSPDISYHQDMAWKASLDNYLLHIGVMLDGHYARKSDGSIDDTLYIAYNMHWENHIFGLPRLKNGKYWELVLSSCNEEERLEALNDLKKSQEEICVYKRSIMVFKAVKSIAKKNK